jgi:hypothetical protein
LTEASAKERAAPQRKELVIMKSKKVLLTILCIVLALGVMSTACAKKTTPGGENSGPDAGQTTGAGTETPTGPATTGTTGPATTGTTGPATDGQPVGGAPNPVVASTPDGILEKLGLECKAPDEYADGAKYSIIDDKVAQVEYTMDSGKGPIKVTYRVSKTDEDEALAISGDNSAYDNSEVVTLDGGQRVTTLTGDGTGPGLGLWHNKNVVGGGVSASVAMDPVMQAEEIAEVALYFMTQESKGF